MPTPEDIQRFGRLGGKVGLHVLEELEDSGRTNLSNEEKADIIFEKIDQIADSHQLKANINLAGRARAGTDWAVNRFTCGWWSEQILKAFNFAGVKGAIAVNSEWDSVSGLAEGVNHNHQAVMYVDEDKNLIVCDIWQYGLDKGRGIGLVSVKGFPQSSRRAMKYADWRKLQLQAGRGAMTFERTSKKLRDSYFFEGYERAAKKRILAKYANKIELEKLFGSAKEALDCIVEILDEMIVEKSTVDMKVLEEMFEKKVQEELKKKTLVPNLFGLRPADANEALRDEDLKPGRVTKTPVDVNNLDMANKVYQQHPASDDNYVVRKSPVDYQHYGPPPLRPVPELIGVSPGEADRRIRQALFTIGDQTALPPDANHPNLHGEVTEQSHQKGDMVPAGTKISYTWRQPDASKRWVQIPDLYGNTPGAADGLITGAGFLIGRRTKTPYDANQPSMAGKVYDQSASGSAEVGTEVSYSFYDVAGPATASATSPSSPSSSPYNPGGLVIKLAGGDRRIFVGDTPLFEAWDKGGVQRYPTASIEWVHSVETVLTVGAGTGQGRALMAGDVTVMAKMEGAWPAFKDLTVWDRAPKLVGMTLAEAERLMERRNLSLKLTNPLEKRADGKRIAQQTPVHKTPVTSTMPIEVAFSLSAQGPDTPPPGTGPDGAHSDVAPTPGTTTTTGTEVETRADSSNETQAQVTVPSVGGLPAARAQALVTGAGLVAALRGGDAAAEKAQEFTVQSQSPPGGTLLNPGGTVTVVVHSAYVDAAKAIPNVVGMAAALAKDTIENAGFTVSLVGGKPAPQESLAFAVQKQVPSAGLPETPVRSVTLTLYSEYSDQVPVPTVAGLSGKEAEALIRDQGLIPEITWGDAASSKDQLGRVQSQEPSPGDMQSTGTTVKVYIYAAVVPALQGLTAAQAEAAINGAWLNPQLFWGDEVQNQTLWKTVQSQSPAASTKVAGASEVTARIYREPPKEKAPQQTLVGRWRGQYDRGAANGKKDPMILDILSVNSAGALEAHLQWPTYDKGQGATTLVKGTVQGTKITFQEVKILKGKGVWTGTNKYVATWEKSQGRIQGTYHYQWDKKWSSGNAFWLTKEE